MLIVDRGWPISTYVDRTRQGTKPPQDATPKLRSQSIRKRRSGNALLESVCTIPPTFALIFAFIEFGLMLLRWTKLQSAVREGCRYAITLQRRP
jgi:Flp pilus assembly protein TadG